MPQHSLEGSLSTARRVLDLAKPRLTRMLASLLVVMSFSGPASAAQGWQSDQELANFLIDEMHHLDPSQHYKDLTSEVCPKVSIEDLNRLRQTFGWVEYTEHTDATFLFRRGDVVWRIARTETPFYSRSLSVIYNRYDGTCEVRVYVDPFVF